MSLTPVTGLTTLNNVLAMIRLKIPIDAPIIKFFTQKILARELNMYFSKLR
jgi:hypothetical protein